MCVPRDAKVAPATELDAIASLPYMVAYAIAEGRVTLEALSEAARGRKDLLQHGIALNWKWVKGSRHFPIASRYTVLSDFKISLLAARNTA